MNGVSYTWDANGNPLDDGVSTYTYDHANRLTSVVQGTDTYTFTYNGLGDRLGQTANGSPTNYTLDLNAGLTQVLDDGTNDYLYGLSRIGEQQPSGWYYHLVDALGSVRQLTDISGAVMLTQSYKPFGNVLASEGSASTAFQFTGEWMDETGLVYLRARYYAPYLNQWIQPDTIIPDFRNPQSINSYSYVNNNPINFTDPSGKSPLLPDHEFQACISSMKLNGVDHQFKENVCWMISELEDRGYLTDIADAEHIPENGGFRLAKTAHKWSTAYHILHDFVSINDLRKTPIDNDGNVWYKDEWDVLYCSTQIKYVDPVSRTVVYWYLDYLVKRNASNNARDIQLGGLVRGYIYYPFGRIHDVNYALEGYEVGDPRRKPNSPLPGISTHVYGLGVDVSEGILHRSVWLGENTAIDDIARSNYLARPLNRENYVFYTDDEKAEWWHFESIK